MFVSISYYANTFEINDEGLASYTLNVSPNIVDGPDKVTAAVKIVNTITKETVYNKTKTLTFNSLQRVFKGSDNCDVKEKGIYELKVTFKCYKGTRLLETIIADPEFASY